MDRKIFLILLMIFLAIGIRGSFAYFKFLFFCREDYPEVYFGLLSFWAPTRLKTIFKEYPDIRDDEFHRLKNEVAKYTKIGFLFFVVFVLIMIFILPILK